MGGVRVNRLRVVHALGLLVVSAVMVAAGLWVLWPPLVVLPGAGLGVVALFVDWERA